MLKLLICYLAGGERQYMFSQFLKLINNSKYKNQWKLQVIITNNTRKEFFCNEVSKHCQDIHFDIDVVEDNKNYMKKVILGSKIATDENIPYFMKCDNDIFFTADVLDFMIDNLDKLDEQHLTLGPVLSSGIPTVEYFAEQYLDPTNWEILKKIFLKTEFQDRDGIKYAQLNECTQNAISWDKNKFFQMVTDTVGHFRGIHPIRINEDALNFINNYILNHPDKFFNKREMEIIYDDNSAYLCNSIFCIKTPVYKSILEDQSLFVDDFDEVPLNKFAWKTGANHLFVKNGFGIHTSYNWYRNFRSYEQYFCNKLFNK